MIGTATAQTDRAELVGQHHDQRQDGRIEEVDVSRCSDRGTRKTFGENLGAHEDHERPLRPPPRSASATMRNSSTASQRPTNGTSSPNMASGGKQIRTGTPSQRTSHQPDEAGGAGSATTTRPRNGEAEGPIDKESAQSAQKSGRAAGDSIRSIARAPDW